jgi:ComF family protein
MLRQVLRYCVDSVFPQSCLLCGAFNHQICPGCLADLPLQGNACRRCAHFLPTGMDLCGTCLHSPPFFQSAQAVFSYNYPLDKLILAGKFHQNIIALNLLGRLMGDYLSPTKADALIPVPLHPYTLEERGYNQATLLARPLAQRFKIPLHLEACACVKYKRQQSQLRSAERFHNVRGAFQVLYVDRAWQRIILLDDVMTTGATLNELSKQFIRAGVPEVEVWCCARA